MNKAEFFKYCKDHWPWGSPRGSPGPHISLRDIWISRTKHNGQIEDNVLYLHGFWADGGAQAVVLYRPWPGALSLVERKLKRAKIKFQRWLDEFNDAEQFVSQLRAGVSRM